jgi:exosortase D (VPLPA-CTERM-specific)
MASINVIQGQQTGLVRTDFLAVGGLLLAIITFGPALSELVQRWNEQAEYSHGYLIPLVTLWLLWTRREALRANIGRPSWLGIIPILLAITMHIIGQLSAFLVFSQIGFVFGLVGIVIAMGGYSLLKVAFIPIVYLLFAIPLPSSIEAALTLQMQLISSQLGASFINLLGIPVYLDGNIIDMGNYKLQVVEACSGLRYVFPLLSLSFLAAYLFQAPIWQRALIFLSAIPIAIGMNGFRIGLLGVLIDRWGPQMAEGALHFFEGWTIFLACAVLLTAEIYMLSLRSGKTLSDVFYFRRVTVNGARKLAVPSVRSAPLAACIFLLGIGGFASLSIAGRSEPLQHQTRLVEFPSRIGDWQGHRSLLDLETEEALKLDDYILSDYSRAGGMPVNLYVGYYASERRGKAPHSPNDCIPAGGWEITNQRETHIITNRGDQQPLNRLVIEKNGIKQLVYYWFDEHGKKTANEYWAKFYRLTNSILENRTDAALIRLITPINPDEPEKNADVRLQSFMQIALPRLDDFLPSSRVPAAQPAALRAPDPS